MLSESDRVVRLAELVASLPQANRGFLAYLMQFASQVAKLCDKNRMPPKNLAIVFAPNLLRAPGESAENYDVNNGLSCVQTMIERCDDIWPSSKYTPNQSSPF